jgi:pilus assembly protein Flp/PilA
LVCSASLDVSGSAGTKEHALKTLFGRFISDQSGAIGMKFALIAALSSVAIFIALGSLGSSLLDMSIEP